jgi:hypothetical protein
MVQGPRAKVHGPRFTGRGSRFGDEGGSGHSFSCGIKRSNELFLTTLVVYLTSISTCRNQVKAKISTSVLDMFVDHDI